MALTAPTSFAQLLNRFRLAHGLTQEELAERAGVSVRGVSDLERGVITKPRPYTVYQLAEALQLDTHDRALFEAAAYQWKVLSGDRPRGQPAPAIGSFLGALPEGPLVAREDEMERILQLLEAASGGTGQLLLLAGERGVGKTRLAQEVMVAAQQQGFLVLTARCHDAGEEDPLTPVWQALAALEQHDSLLGNAELARRWQEILVLAQMSDRLRLFPAIAELVRQQSDVSPLALLLDDVQRATPATIQLVDHLARSTRTTRVFLLATYREAKLSDDNPTVAHAIQDLIRERLAERITLRRFMPEETAALASLLMGQEEVSEEFAGFLHRRSKGNPRYIEELVRSLGGRLELEGEIGAGAMGRVFAAYDRKTGREVAAKLMLARDEIRMETQHSFQQESAILASLRHPHIIEIYDSFIEEHASCIIMERVEGRSLRQVLEDGPLSLPRAKQLAQQVAAALDHAHQAQIVHRDVKPDNIMVTADDQVKVTDFGIARILQPDITLRTIATTGMRVGTPLYMAPEQIRGKPADGRADVYALGAVLFHMVTGRPPFEGDDALAIAIQHLQDEPPQPSSVNPAIPEDWDAAIGKALTKDSAKRFQSAREMERAIRALDERPRTTSGVQDMPWMAGALRRVRRRARALPITSPLPSRMIAIAASCAAALAAAAFAFTLLPGGGKSGEPAIHSTATAPAVLASWGTTSGATMPFGRPTLVVPTPGGDAYVIDDTRIPLHVLRISSFGRQLSAWSINGPVGQGVGVGARADTHGNLWMTLNDGSTLSRVQEYSPDGRLLASWGSYGFNPGQFEAPQGLGVASNDDVIVGDLGTHRIQVLTGSGKPLREWLGPGNDPLNFYPAVIAVDSLDNVYVFDIGNRQIEKYALDGKLLAVWHPPGLQEHPCSTVQYDHGVSLSRCVDLAVDSRDDVDALWSGTDFLQIDKLSPSGRPLATWSHLGTIPGISSGPTSLQFDHQGLALAAVPSADRVLKIDTAGRVLHSWTARQLQEPLLRSPLSVATDGERAYVTDGGRVVGITVGGRAINSWSTSKAGRADSFVEAINPRGDIVLADMKGRSIATYSPSGRLLDKWGRSGSNCGDLGQPAAVGVAGQGNVVVDDVADSTVETFTSTGRLIRCFDTSAYSPLVSSNPGVMAVDTKGDFYLSLVDKIIEFSPGGAPLRSWGGAGTGAGKFFTAGAVAVDTRRNVYATDLELNRLQVFSGSGKLLASWTGLGRTSPRFSNLGGVTVDSRGNIYLLNGAQLLELAPLTSR